MNIENKNDNNETNRTSYIGSTEGTFKKRLYQHKSDQISKKTKTKQHSPTIYGKTKKKDQMKRRHMKYSRTANLTKVAISTAKYVFQNAIKFLKQQDQGKLY